MLNTRVIPCLLLDGRRLVKTVRFRNERYVGDVLNAVRIFNTKQVDELLLLDITATAEGRGPQRELISRIADECAMPLTVGGGVRDVETARALLAAGAEKVAIHSAALEDPELVTRVAAEFGSQSVVACLDVRRRWGRHAVYSQRGRRRQRGEPAEVARTLEAAGAGEILVQSIDQDGTGAGYDLSLVRAVSDAVRVPVIACGGAGSVDDLAQVARQGGASAAAAGSLFVFHGPRRAVLISFPTPAELEAALVGVPASSPEG